MNDVKRINRQFLGTLITFILFLLAAVSAVIVTNIFMQDEAWQYLVYFVIMILVLLVVIMFKNKFDQLTNISYIIKIRSNPGEPLPMHHTKLWDRYPFFLKEKGFTQYAFDQKHMIFYRVIQDQIKKIFRKHMIEVVVLLDPHCDGFYLEQVDNEIQQIQQKHLKERIKMDRMLITQIKPIQDLSDKTKEEIKEIIFLKTKDLSLFLRSNTTIISTINIGLYQPTSTAVMLYSETYSPSLYYTHHINEIKSMI
ncbi:MAG: hypothetical protein WC992_07480 [Acholeplasmataceae bacterium]